MVSLFRFLLRSLCNRGKNDKDLKRERKNETQYMILLKSSIFGSTKSEFCLNKDFQKLIKKTKFFIN